MTPGRNSNSTFVWPVCPVLSYLVLSSVLLCSFLCLCCAVLFCTVLSALSRPVLYCAALSCPALCCQLPRLLQPKDVDAPLVLRAPALRRLRHVQCEGSAQLPGPLDSGLLAPPDTGLLLLKKMPLRRVKLSKEPMFMFTMMPGLTL